MAFLKKLNNVKTTITDNPLSDSALVVNILDVAVLPATGDYMLTIWDKGTYPVDPHDDPNMEIVRGTANTAGAVTIVRAQEGTTAHEHPQGSAIECLITGGVFDEMADQNLKKADDAIFNSIQHSNLGFVGYAINFDGPFVATRLYVAAGTYNGQPFYREVPDVVGSELWWDSTNSLWVLSPVGDISSGNYYASVLILGNFTGYGAFAGYSCSSEIYENIPYSIDEDGNARVNNLLIAAADSIAGFTFATFDVPGVGKIPVIQMRGESFFANQGFFITDGLQFRAVNNGTGQSASLAIGLGGGDEEWGSVSLEYLYNQNKLWIDTSLQLYDTDDPSRPTNLILGDHDITVNPYFRLYGNITAAGGAKYINLVIDDTDDYLHLTKETADILGLKINMDTRVGDDTVYWEFTKKTFLLDNGEEGPLELIFPEINPSPIEIFGGEPGGVFRGQFIVYATDGTTEVAKISLVAYDPVAQSIAGVDMGMVTDYTTFIRLMFDCDVQFGTNGDPDFPYIIVSEKNITVGEDVTPLRAIQTYDIDGDPTYTVIEGGLMLIGGAGLTDNSLAFVGSDGSIQGFFGYANSDGRFIILGNENGPGFGPITRFAEADLMALTMCGFLGTNETGDVGRIPFAIGVPGFLFPSTVEGARIELVLTYVGNSYPDDDDASSAMDFYTRNLGGIAHVLRLGDNQKVGIGNKNPQHKLEVTGDLMVDQLNTSFLTEELLIDLSAVITDLELGVPILGGYGYSSLPEAFPYPYGTGIWDEVLIFDKSDQDVAKITFAKLNLLNSGAVGANLDTGYLWANWDWCPEEDDTYSLGRSSLQWINLYLSGKIIVGGVSAVADGTYTVGAPINPSTGVAGQITVKGGIITAIQEAT